MKKPQTKKEPTPPKETEKKEACEFTFYSFKSLCYIGSLEDSVGQTTFGYTEEYETVIVISEKCNLRLAKSTLLHELFEVAIKLSRCEFGAMNGNNATEFYQFGHNELDMICEAVFSAYEKIVPFLIEQFAKKEAKND